MNRPSRRAGVSVRGRGGFRVGVTHEESRLQPAVRRASSSGRQLPTTAVVRRRA